MHKIRKIICISIMCIGCLLMTILLGGVTSIENEIIMAAGALYNQSGSGSATNLSAEVEAYRSIMQYYAEQAGISDYVDLLLAIMQQESAGRGSDVMQTSEALGLAPGTLSAERSIQEAVRIMAELISSCNVKSPADEPGIRLLLQAYNFGSGYVTHALNNGGGWSQASTDSYAKKYSHGRKRSGKAAEIMGEWAYGDQHYTDHVLRYYTISSTPGTSDSTGSGTVSGGVAGNIPKEARKAYLFPNGVPQTESAMRTYLTTISVPINDIFGNPNTMNLTVHKKLAEDVRGVFVDMQRAGFRIEKNQTAAFCWRTISSNHNKISYHAYGSCIDINWNHNPYTTSPPANYRPGADPLSIPDNVVAIWKKHGFYWGGDWKSAKDYMHFTFTGN